MIDKEQIEEMVRIIDNGTNTTCFSRDKEHTKCGDCEKCWTYSIAKILYNAGYRKLSKEAQEMVSNALVYSKRLKIEKSAEKVRKETAKEILQKIKGRANWFLESQIQEDHFVEQIKELAEEYGVEIEK